MHITLETVRAILKESLGFQSFTVSFIQRVVEDNRCATAYINKDGTLDSRFPIGKRWTLRVSVVGCGRPRRPLSSLVLLCVLPSCRFHTTTITSPATFYLSSVLSRLDPSLL